MKIENKEFLRNTVQGIFRIYRNIQENPRIEGYTFIYKIISNSQEYKGILHNAHESAGKPTTSHKYGLTLSNLPESIYPSGLFLPFMHRTLDTLVPISKGVNYFTT